MILTLVLVAAPQEPAPVAPLFADVTGRALPGVTTTCGRVEKDYIVEVNGGGLVLGDFDADGHVDLVVVDGSTLERVARGEPGYPPRYFHGDGKGVLVLAQDHAADELPTHWRMAGGRWGMGGAAGDVDNDGFLDLVITEWGPDRLLRNDGGRGFTELGAASGLAQDNGWSTSAAFLDYDEDGRLDLFVTSYLEFDPEHVESRTTGKCTWKGHAVMCGPEGLVPTPDRLYRGQGDATFVDVTKAAGIQPDAEGFGLGVITVDVEPDGDTDLYVANDSTPNHLWVNRGDGTFVEEGLRRNVSHDGNGREQAGMGLAAGDVSGDGLPDLFVTNFSGENNAYYRSGPRGIFRERSDAAGFGGPSLPFLGWGTGMHDFDLDGDLDFFVLNGHVYPEAARPGTDTRYAQAAQLYRNTGAAFFTIESLEGGPDRVWRTGAAADLDEDGDLDLVAIELDGPVHVLENRATGRHWLRVRLIGKQSNRSGIGARLRAHWEGGSATAEVRTAGGYQTAVPAEAHFGLGPVAKLERLVVSWPSGREQVLADVAVDRVLVIEESTE